MLKHCCNYCCYSQSLIAADKWHRLAAYGLQNKPAPSLCRFDAWHSDAVQRQPSPASQYRAWTQGCMHGHGLGAAQVRHEIYSTGGTRTQQGVADAVRCVSVPCSDPPAECLLHMAVQTDRPLLVSSDCNLQSLYACICVCLEQCTDECQQPRTA